MRDRDKLLGRPPEAEEKNAIVRTILISMSAFVLVSFVCGFAFYHASKYDPLETAALASPLNSYPAQATGGDMSVPFSGITVILDERIAVAINKENLEKALAGIFAKPISILVTELNYEVALNKNRSQFWAPRMLEIFSEVAPQETNDFRVFIVGDDIYDEPYNFLYMFTEADNRLAVLSLARVATFEEGLSDQRKMDIASDRIVKLFMKSVARVAGLYESDGCVMRFPHNMDELDATPPEYCAEDAERLRNAGVVRN